MNLKQALKRIEELEARVKALENRPYIPQLVIDSDAPYQVVTTTDGLGNKHVYANAWGK